MTTTSKRQLPILKFSEKERRQDVFSFLASKREDGKDIIEKMKEVKEDLGEHINLFYQVPEESKIPFWENVIAFNKKNSYSWYGTNVNCKDFPKEKEQFILDKEKQAVYFANEKTATTPAFKYVLKAEEIELPKVKFCCSWEMFKQGNVYRQRSSEESFLGFTGSRKKLYSLELPKDIPHIKIRGLLGTLEDHLPEYWEKQLEDGYLITKTPSHPYAAMRFFDVGKVGNVTQPCKRKRVELKKEWNQQWLNAKLVPCIKAAKRIREEAEKEKELSSSKRVQTEKFIKSLQRVMKAAETAYPPSSSSSSS